MRECVCLITQSRIVPNYHRLRGRVFAAQSQLQQTAKSNGFLTVLEDVNINEKMADTSQQQQQHHQQQEAPESPQTNGAIDGLTEEEKSKMRPADIDADMREMERRKRVEMMMNSRLFREELERIIETQMKDGAGPSGLLQQISEMMGPQGARFNANVFRNSNCVVPINDIRGVESMGYAKGEKLLRCKLAAVFRLLDLYGWTQGVAGMITARLNQDQEHFLVNPYGLLYHETTASSLVKADMQGGIVEQGTTNFGVHIASYQLHSTIHAARPDIKCIVHIATPSVTAISATKCGMLPIGQESIVIGEVSNHHYISGANLDPEEREKLARNFGPVNKVMLLTNRGALCCGETVEEAFFNVYNTVLACETQLKLMPLGIDNLSLISDETRKAIYEASRKAPVPQHSSVTEPSPLTEKLEKRWRIGGTEFEALMRMLDNAGFRTGYIYRHPLVKSEPPRPRNDVEVPPAVSSLGYLLEEEELYKQGLWKGGRKGTDRTRWLNSPNVYQKVEILETGTPDPKKITKWVSDGSPTHSSTPVKIDGALQFVPKNTNPKEFKQLQQQIKDYRRADKISAGPQSHILEGVTWEEAKKMQDATISGTGEQVVLVGAASKGIIQRGFQHNAMVYKTPYAKNPFDAVTDQELDQYKKEIERKTKGDPYDESQSESEALSSFNISRATHESSTAKSPIQSPVSVTSETEEESRDEPKVLRIETKQVPAPSQPEVVLSDGVSGVSRLSSSRSNSSNSITERNWPWCDNYQPCYIETTRLEKLAQPTRPLLTVIQNLTAIKRKIKKRDFFENYEKRFKRNAQTELGVSKNNTKMLKARRQLQDEMKISTQVSDIQCSKIADINFAEKINLPIENVCMEATTTNVNYVHKQNTLPSVTIIQMNTRNNADTKIDNINKISNLENITRKYAAFHVDDEEVIECVTATQSFLTTTAVNNTVLTSTNSRSFRNKGKHNIDESLKITYLGDDKVIHRENEENRFLFMNSENELLNSTLKVSCCSKTRDCKQEIVFNESNNDTNVKCIADLDNNETVTRYTRYINELELSVGHNSNKSSSEDQEQQAKQNRMATEKLHYENKYHDTSVSNINNSNANFVQVESINLGYKNNLEATNYVNEIEFFVCNNSDFPRKDTMEDKLAEDPLSSLSTVYILKESQSNRIEDYEVSQGANPDSLLNNQSTPLDLDDIKHNPLESSFKKFLKNEYSLTDKFVDDEYTINKDEEDLSNCSFKSCKNKSDVNGNLWSLIGNDNVGFVIDASEQSKEFSKSVPNCLDFTYSEIDKYNEDFSPASTTRCSFFSDDDLVMKQITRRDSILEVVSSINADMKPSNKLIVDSLADTENSSKYNLDSQNMSLIYSITPPNDVGDSSKDTTITEDIFEDPEENCKPCQIDNDNEDAIWINLSNTRKEVHNKTTELSETSFLSNVSNQGSDLLELPRYTYLDLQRSSDETFQKNMTTSVNQILTELNYAEASDNATHFVDELLFDVACLNLPSDITRYSKIELNNFIREKIWSLNFARKLAKDLVGNLPCYDVNNSTNSKVSSIEESSKLESLNQSVYVIREIIHHIVDKDSLGKCDYKSKKPVRDKKFKESMNIELKGLKDEYDVTDEQSLKCSTPKIVLSPKMSRKNSLSEEEIITDIENHDGDENHDEVIVNNATIISKSQQSSDIVLSSHSSPSTESHNFAEQEITSESTDNDTKSDNSKEKAVENGILKNQSVNNNLNPITNCNLMCQDEKVEISHSLSNQISFCVIECLNEEDFNLQESHTNVYLNKNDSDTDTDESIKDFMQSFMNFQEDIDHMWQMSEARLEEIYATQRLGDISGIQNDVINCQENIRELLQEVNMESSSIFHGVEQESISFVCNDGGSDEQVETHLPSKQVDEVCTCCLTNQTVVLENTKHEILSPISEEPELEYLEPNKSQSCETISLFNTLPFIFDEPGFHSSYDDILDEPSDSRTIEFNSCQNSTFTVSSEDIINSEKIYSANASGNTDMVSISSTITDQSKIAISNINSINLDENIIENIADTSSTSSRTCNNEKIVLECMTYSYDTTEFLKLEKACSNDDINHANTFHAD